jgi:hypothetical protein
MLPEMSAGQMDVSYEIPLVEGVIKDSATVISRYFRQISWMID